MKISTKIKTLAAGSAAVVGTAVNAGAAFATKGDNELHCPGEYSKTVKDLSECTKLSANSNNNNLMGTVNTIINVIIGVIGFVAVVIIILGGVQYTTSAGDPGKVKKAKDTILYGIIGVVVALLAYSIVNFVLSSVFGN